MRAAAASRACSRAATTWRRSSRGSIRVLATLRGTRAGRRRWRPAIRDALDPLLAARPRGSRAVLDVLAARGRQSPRSGASSDVGRDSRARGSAAASASLLRQRTSRFGAWPRGARRHRPTPRPSLTPLGAGKSMTGSALQRLAHVRRPDRGGDVAARVAVPELARRVVAHPDAGDQVGREADEPGVTVVVRGARLAGDRTADLRRLAGAPLDDVLHHARQLVRLLGGEHALEARPRVLELDRPALRVGDAR